MRVGLTAPTFFKIAGFEEAFPGLCSATIQGLASSSTHTMIDVTLMLLLHLDLPPLCRIEADVVGPQGISLRTWLCNT